ncbi:MAG TPA: sulfite exporter TauE/SafE family protein [Acidimicrobiales bacterium]|nr:sulfite exporter TauE/SafE family protein [Acidimicrobiales bacterium]
MSTLAAVHAVVHAAASAASPVPASHSSWLLGLSGFLGGIAVGIAGMGGGALMTPVLVLLFKLDPRVAIASDLVNSLAMKPVGGAVHAANRSVNWALVRLLVLPGAPAAFFGAWVLNQLGDSKTAQAHLKTLLGWALIVACTSMATRATLTARLKRRGRTPQNPAPWRLKPVPTFCVGLVGGFMVGMTSVGSGSLVIVLLMLLYPRLSANVQVGTNLVQAVPVVATATLGQIAFGHIDLHVAGSLIVGSIPGTFLGARISSRAPENIVRPILVALLTTSGLALLITSYTGLAIALAIALVVGAALWGSVDATLHLYEDWEEAGHDRTVWVSLMGVGAPLGVGSLFAAYYAVGIRPKVVAASKRAIAAHEALANALAETARSGVGATSEVTGAP